MRMSRGSPVVQGTTSQLQKKTVGAYCAVGASRVKGRVPRVRHSLITICINRATAVGTIGVFTCERAECMPCVCWNRWVLTEWVKDMFQPLRAWADLRT